MNARKTYLQFIILQEFGMSLTYTSYVPYLRELGLGPSDVSAVNIGFWIALLGCELPTGVFADRHGRARSVQVGISIFALSALLYATASGFITAVLYEMLIGVGLSFISGALSAWIREAHTNSGNGTEHTYAQTIARGAQFRSLASLVGGLLGGLLGMINARLTWLGAGCILLLAAGHAYKHMHDGPRRVHPDGNEKGPLRKSWELVQTRRDLRWVILVYVAFSCVLPFNHYWAMFFRSKIGIPSTTALWAPINLTLALAAFLVHRFGVSKKQEGAMLCMSLFSAGIGLALMGTTPGFALPFLALFLHEFGRGLFFPLLDVFTQTRIEDSYRATYASLQSLLARIGNVLVLAVVWTYTSDLAWSNAVIGTVWFTSGVVLVFLSLLLWRKKP